MVTALKRLEFNVLEDDSKKKSGSKAKPVN
jgi:hypothetical protein